MRVRELHGKYIIASKKIIAIIVTISNSRSRVEHTLVISVNPLKSQLPLDPNVYGAQEGEGFKFKEEAHEGPVSKNKRVISGNSSRKTSIIGFINLRRTSPS
jgi:hypothetical protein